MIISGVIHTYNEAKNIGNAIGSLLPWVDEVVVIDMHSEDGTQAIAEQMGARVVLHERQDFVEPARNFGIEQCRGEWIVTLDADEMIPAALAGRLKEMAERDSCDVVLIPRKNYILGRAFDGAGWGPQEDTGPRFFKRGQLDCPAAIHSPFAIHEGARVARLTGEADVAIVHFNYVDVAQVLSKMGRYTTIEARELYERGVTISSSAAGLRAARSFASRFLYRRGYREGWQGLFMCMLMVMYEMAIFAKLKEKEGAAAHREADRCYRLIADKLLAEYDRTR